MESLMNVLVSSGQWTIRSLHATAFSEHSVAATVDSQLNEECFVFKLETRRS